MRALLLNVIVHSGPIHLPFSMPILRVSRSFAQSASRVVGPFLCFLSDLCVSVVSLARSRFTTETQRAQRGKCAIKLPQNTEPGAVATGSQSQPILEIKCVIEERTRLPVECPHPVATAPGSV